MSEARKDHRKAASKQPGDKERNGEQREPGWAAGLKKLYDSVVEEPLPDAFKDLLSRLDDAGK